uniref:F-box domain-containing protein n=1 Tax=Tetranychus urticae TaxID=32264 RepID=T1KIP8_TETUR
MNIDKLPDDCLLHIFNFFSKFGTLLNCSQVCERWKYLVLQRLSNVKYLADYGPIESYPVRNTILYEYEDRYGLIKRIEWFPKLKIIESGSEPEFFSNPTVEGFLFSLSNSENFTNCNSSLKMLAVDGLYDFYANDIQGPMLDQLHINSCSISKFSKYAKYFPNLKRLHIEHHTLDDFEDTFYTGPSLEKLEILEVIGSSQWGSQYDYHGFSLADKCPVLKSAYHYIDREDEFWVNSGIKNHFLEDLSGHAYPNWSILRRVLCKYPNLKHLAIRRGYDCISHENVIEIIHMLPHITLIDIRDSKKVDENTTRYIAQYCRDHNRSISLYYQKRPKISKNWPHLSTKRTRIGRGLDFMKHCFLKTYCNDFPYLLDPDE